VKKSKIDDRVFDLQVKNDTRYEQGAGSNQENDDSAIFPAITASVNKAIGQDGKTWSTGFAEVRAPGTAVSLPAISAAFPGSTSSEGANVSTTGMHCPVSP